MGVYQPQDRCFQGIGCRLQLPKIHLMFHWVEQIRRYGALQQYSAEKHEPARGTNVKDGWNASNHNLNYLPQVITCQRRILCFKISELNLQALIRRWENRAAACKVLPSGADLAAPLGSQSYVKPEFMGPQNCCDGKHSDEMIKDSRALLDNTQDVTHCVAIYSGTREFMKHKSRKKTISKKYFRLGIMAPSEWTRFVRAVRDTPMADYSVPGLNTMHRVAYRPTITVAPFLLPLSVFNFK